jgi:cytochrome c
MGVAEAAEELPAGDPVLGKRQFAQCTACHSLTADGANKVGPNLHGVYGRKAGSKADFAYSDALKNAGFDWDSEKLDQYIRKPSAFLPGNKMAFIGIAKDEVRTNIIAYLKEASK